jgi:hypothetical protein
VSSWSGVKEVREKINLVGFLHKGQDFVGVVCCISVPAHDKQIAILCDFVKKLFQVLEEVALGVGIPDAACDKLTVLLMPRRGHFAGVGRLGANSIGYDYNKRLIAIDSKCLPSPSA